MNEVDKCLITRRQKALDRFSAILVGTELVISTDFKAFSAIDALVTKELK